MRCGDICQAIWTTHIHWDQAGDVSDPDLSTAYRVEILLGAAQSDAQDDPRLAAQSVRVLMDAVRPRAVNSLEIEHAQAIAYLALDHLYDALGSGQNADDPWTDSLLAVRAWKRLLDPRSHGDQAA